jgi:hypothetical protein
VENLPTWKQVIQSGKKTADQIIAMVQTKGTLTLDQEQQIRDCEITDAEVIEE